MKILLYYYFQTPAKNSQTKNGQRSTNNRLVWRHQNGKRYLARYCAERLGTYDTSKEAAAAYDTKHGTCITRKAKLPKAKLP